MSYSLSLASDEIDTLQWMANRGYFPQEILTKMSPETDPDDAEASAEIVYTMPEHVAWSLIDLREKDPDAYLACLDMRSSLAEKVLKLESEIV